MMAPMDGPQLPRPAHPALHLVAHQEDAVTVAELAEPDQKVRRRNDVPALALDGLDENRRHFLRGRFAPEDRLLDLVDREIDDRSFAAPLAGTVGVRIGDMGNLRDHRHETLAVDHLGA
jgi:hypothetical protein